VLHFYKNGYLFGSRVIGVGVVVLEDLRPATLFHRDTAVYSLEACY